MNAHASAGLVVNRADRAVAACSCGREFSRTGATASGYPPSFAANAALERHIRTEADKVEAARPAPAPRVTLVVELDSAAWASATEEERARWVADLEDAANEHGRVVGVVQ